MKCQRCGASGAKWQGVDRSESGPSENEAVENSELVYAWLCGPCQVIDERVTWEEWYEQCEAEHQAFMEEVWEIHTERTNR